MKRALAALLVSLPITVHASTLSGRVVSVVDGDTLHLLTPAHQEIKVRLAEIDAPEKKQAFGMRSKQSLSDMCFGKDASIDNKGLDRYGRTIGRITCAGTDANAEQVRRGMAWVYDKYATDMSLYQLQDKAKTQHLGLWSDPSPVAPWEFRHGHKKFASP